MRWGALITISFGLAGCYEPKIEGCNIACDSDQACPDNFVCNSGLCRAALDDDRCPAVPAVATGGRHACAVNLGVLSCWGANDFGQADGSGTLPVITTPTIVGADQGVTAWLAVDAGSRHTCAIGLENGARRLYCWGANDVGQAGGSAGTTAFTEVTAVVDPVEITAGGSHSCARTAAGRLFCWGANADGELGTGNTSEQEPPGEQVLGERTDWAHVAAGNGSTCATRNDGSVHCWGRNELSQLGIGPGGASQLEPREVGGAIFDPGSPARALAVGNGTACVVHDDGGTGPVLRCWGDNRDRQAGQLDIDEVPDATDSIAGFGSTAAWIDVRAGDRFACAMASDRQIYCWGQEDARLGDNTNAPRTAPGPDSSKPLRDAEDLALGRAIAFDVGDAFGCALFEGEDQPRCWGSNSLGQLGNGETTTVPIASPITPPPAPPDKWRVVRVGPRFSCGINEGVNPVGVFCWGDNASRQTNPISTQLLQLEPIAVGLSGPVVDIALGDDHACALLDPATVPNTVQCWGSNAFHELGVLEDTSFAQPVLPMLVNMSDRWVQIAAGQNVTCVVSNNIPSRVACWGSASWLDALSIDPSVPTFIDELDSLSLLRFGPDGGCGLAITGINCWGSDANGLRGDGQTQAPTFPTTTIASALLMRTVSDSIGSHRCAGNATLGAKGFCWGDNTAHQIDPTDSPDFDVPHPIDVFVVQELDATRRTMASGRSFTCAIKEDGLAPPVVCWGDNSLLQGTITGGNDGIPRAITFESSSSTGAFASVSAGEAHACALDADEHLLCWGSSSHGQTGRGAFDPDFVVAPRSR